MARLEGSPNEYLHQPIVRYLEVRGARIHTRRQARQILFAENGSETQVTGLAIAQGDTEETIVADA
jgi:zeta-carotene desaturase